MNSEVQIFLRSLLASGHFLLLPAVASLPLLHIKREFTRRFRQRQQLISRLLGKNLEIDYSAGISGHNLQYLTGYHVHERFFSAQYGQRTIQSAHIQFFIAIHANSPLLVARSRSTFIAFKVVPPGKTGDPTNKSRWPIAAFLSVTKILISVRQVNAGLSGIIRG